MVILTILRMCAAPVRTLAHWASLTVYTTSLIPGEKPKLSEVKEQRLTSFSIHILIFLCLQAKSLLRVIPVPVLFGVFLYFGIVSLSGTQLFERMGFIFVPFKYCPNLPHAVGVCLILLITILFKFYNQFTKMGSKWFYLTKSDFSLGLLNRFDNRNRR